MPDIRRTRKRKLSIDRTEIAERVIDFFEREDSARDDEKNRRIQRYAKYRMWVEGKDWPWADASDVPLPDMMEKSLRTQDTLHNAVMSSRPVIGANAMDSSDKEKERTIDRLIDHQVFVEQKGEEMIGDLADAFTCDGDFKVFIPWVKEMRDVSDVQLFDPVPDDMLPIEYFEALLRQQFPDQPLVPRAESQGWDWDGPDGRISFYTRKDKTVEMIQRREAVVYDGPLVIQKEWDEVLFPARAANLQIPGPSNPHGAAHVLLVDFPTVDEVQRLATNGTYDLLTKDDLDGIENVPTSGVKNQEMRDEKDALQGVTPDDDQKVVEHKTLTRLMCFDIFDVDGDGTTEDVVWWVILETRKLARAKLLTEIYPSDPPRRPLVSEAFLPIRGRVGGIGLLEMMEGLHDVAKTVLDQTIDAGTIKNVPFFFYRPSGSMKPEIITLSPGEGYPVQDPQRDLFFPSFAQGDQTFGINMLTMMTQMQERLTTIGDLQLGRVPVGGSSALRTIGGMALIAGQGEARPERILRRFFRGLAEIWSHIHELNQHFLPEEKKIRIVGLKEVGEDPYLEAGRKTVQGRFEFDFKANVLNTSRAALQEGLGNLMSVYVSELFLQMGIIDADGVYRLARDFGFAQGQEPDQYLIAPSPDSLKRRIFAEEAISSIIDGEIPDGIAAEAGGALEHLQKLIAFSEDDRFGLLSQEQVQVYRGYLEEVQQQAVAQQQQQATAQAAQNFGNGQPGQPGRPVQGPPQDPNQQAPLQQGELRDESLPGAGGGANGGLQ